MGSCSGVSNRKFDNVSGLNRYLNAQRRLSIAFSSAQIIYASFSKLFGGCAFWRAESRAAEVIFARARKAREMQPGLLVGHILADHTQKLNEMKERLNRDIERFVILKNFEDIYDNFEEVVLEAREFLKENEEQYAESNKWRIETEALRERLGEALSIVRFKEERYIKEFRTCDIGEVQKLTDRIKTELNGIFEEKVRLVGLVARDMFYPLRDPVRMFGKLADEIEETKGLVKRMIAEYGDAYRGNRFWLSEIEELNFRRLVGAVEEYGRCKKVDLGRADRETLSAMDEKLQDLTKSLSSGRKRFEVMANQNIFGLLADREKSYKLLQKQLSELEEVLFKLNRRFKEDYSWSVERKRLEEILREAEQALEMSEIETLDRNKLIRAVTRLESKAAIIKKEREGLKSLAEQKDLGDIGPKKQPPQKPDGHQDELSGVVRGLIQEVNDIEKRTKTLRATFTLIGELEEKFNALWASPSSEETGGNGGRKSAAHKRPVAFAVPEG